MHVMSTYIMAEDIIIIILIRLVILMTLFM